MRYGCSWPVLGIHCANMNGCNPSSPDLHENFGRVRFAAAPGIATDAACVSDRPQAAGRRELSIRLIADAQLPV